MISNEYHNLMFATNSNLILGSFYNDFLNIMCVFKIYSLNLTKQKQNYFLVCWYYLYIIYLHILCSVVPLFHIIMYRYRLTLYFCIMYRPRLLSKSKRTEKQHKHQICHMPHAALLGRIALEFPYIFFFFFASPKFVFHSGILFAFFFDNA